jgi:hypothetical protein
MIKLAAGCALAACWTLAVAEPGTSAEELLGDANRVLQQLDAEQYAQVWQDAAPFVQARTSREPLVNLTRPSSQALGAVSMRGLASITRIRYTNVASVPDGLYANADYATTLASGRTVFERVSYQLESDVHWRLTAYVPRQSQGDASGPLPIAKS